MFGAARNVACAGGRPIGFTDCLNFGNPEKPEIAWELARGDRRDRGRGERDRRPGRLGQRVALQRDRRPRDPADAGRRLRRARARRAPRSRAAGAPATPSCSRAFPAGPLDVAAEAALVAFLWKVAPLVSLAHDVGSAGLEAALDEAAEWSGRRAEVDLPEEPLGGAAILACAPEDVDALGSRGLARDRRGDVAVCGVFGIRSPQRDVARIAYFGLFALQHRGQESAGIAVSDSGRLTVLRDMGLVSQVFDEQNLSGLHGDAAIGHTRYSTTGSTHWANAQPLLHHGRARTIALGHNGNLTNAPALRAQLADDGVKLSSTSDSELIAALVASASAPLEEAVAGAMARLEGAYSVVALSEGTLLAFRDPHGFRPLVLGRLDGEWVVASETCALDLVGAAFEREVAPGELVLVDADGLRSVQAVEPAEHGALCIFEFFYLARPDTRLEGVEVHGGARADGRAARRRGAGRRRPRAADPRVGHAGRDRVLARDAASRSARA